MRKALACMFILAVLSAAVLTAAHRAITACRTAVRVTETTLQGDSAAAEGLELQVTANYDRHLYWQTNYAAGIEPTQETSFRFYPKRREREQVFTETLDFQTASLNYGMGGDGIDLESYESGEDYHHETMMVKPAIDLASRTDSWETKTEVFRLRDYYEFYKMRGSTRLNGSYLWDDEWLGSFADYFRIPVPEDLLVEVTVTKNAMGQISDVDMHELDMSGSYYAYASSVFVDNTFYFVMVTDENKGLDLSQIPDYGIWALPFRIEEKQGMDAVHYGELRLVMPLDRETVTAKRLTASADGTKLYLVTKEAEALFLTVLDCETMTQLHRIRMDCEEVPDIWEVENLLVLKYGKDTDDIRQPVFQVLELSENGCTMWPEMPLFPYIEGYWRGEPELAFDGRYLAVAVLQDEWITGSVRLAVYTKDGVAYVGDYHYSGDDISRDLGVNDEHRLTLWWNRR